MVNSEVKIGRMKLKNPVMAASGTFGPEYGDIIDMNSLGAIVMKTITIKPRVGNPPPRVVETASGMLNSIGLENKGVDDFIKNKIPLMASVKVPIIASIAGSGKEEFEKLARRLNSVKEIDALELNLSCPNIRYGARESLIAHDEKATYSVVAGVRKATGLTLIVKLSPGATNIAGIAKAAEAGGADAVSLVNTFLGMAVDIETKKPKLGNITGGLSGPAIKPLSLRCVWEAYKEIDIPIIGIGGIMDYKDAVEFMLCGASAIQVGTANFINPQAPIEIVKGIEAYLKKNRISGISHLVGGLKLG